MAKRSTFALDLLGRYDTPPAAVVPLLPHLPVPGPVYWEPCAGCGALISALERWADCAVATDIEPRAEGIYRMPGDHVAPGDLDGSGIDMIITNPPWPRGGRAGDPALSLIKVWSALRPTWCLLAADFMHNLYFRDLAPICRKIVSVGRVSWAGNGKAGTENAAWYLFDAAFIGRTRFYPRGRA